MARKRKHSGAKPATLDQLADHGATVLDGASFAEMRALLNRADADLREFYARWDVATQQDLARLRSRLARAKSEREMQRYLEGRPSLLVEHLGGGHARWVIPQPRLGAEHVPDFLIGERNSAGFKWQAVELESPRALLFTRRSDPTSALTHAIRQIQDWRTWLQTHQDYATRARMDGGLGLPHISSHVRGMILIGRRSAIDPRTDALRRQMMDDLRIEIHSYDYLLDAIASRVDVVRRFPNLQRPSKALPSAHRHSGEKL